MTDQTTRRVLLAHEFGAPESFVLTPRDPGLPGPGKVRIRMHAAGVSFVDILVAAGKYQVKPPLPMVPGSECAGVIEAVGEGVAPARIGQRVMACGFGFAFAEAAVIPEKLAIPIPDAMGFAEGAVFQVSYATAYYALVQRAALKPGETLLVLGAAGAVGCAAIELGVALGAKVIASASSPEKRALTLATGAAQAIDSRSATWRDDLKAANGGKGVDVVVDPIGGGATELAFRSLAWGGRQVVIGFASGEIPRLPTNLVLLKGAALLGVELRLFCENEPETAAANMKALFALYGAGKLHPPIAQTYRFEDFAPAMNRAAAGDAAGRIVLLMD
jgi:NADPH2:quinone reductase